MSNTKVCKGPCGLEKPLEEFGRDKKNKDGLKSTCKSCRCAMERERGKEKWASDPVFRAMKRQKLREWRSENPEKALHQTRRYDAANREKRKLKEASRRKDNPVAVAASQAKYYALNGDKRRAYQRLISKARRANLHDNYIKTALRCRRAPLELIEQKREQLADGRTLKAFLKALNNKDEKQNDEEK